MLASYGGAVLLLLASVALGQAVFALGGWRRWCWVGPAVGLAALVVLCDIAIRLPGRATTSAIVVLLALIASVAILVFARPPLSLPWRPLIVASVPVAFASLPFVANRRVGILGVGLNDDTAVHLLWAEGLRSPLMAALYPANPGYPLGPHSVMATLASATGMRMDHALLALLIVVLPITALAAAGTMARAAWWRQAIVAAVVATGYLVAAYYGEGAFKETMMALFLLAFVVFARDLVAAPGNRRGWRQWARAGIPAGTLAAGAVYTYSYLALAWLVGFLGLWLAAELVARPELVLSGRLRRSWLVAAGVSGVAATVTFGVLAAPGLGRILNYFEQVGSTAGGAGIPSTNLGNLAGPLPPYEGLGLWMQPDFRFVPAQTFHYGQLAGLALAVLIFGALWSLRRRDLALPAAVGICAIVWWYSDGHQSPYVSAKALVIATPLVLLLGTRALVSGREEDPAGGFWSLVRLAAGLAFAALALFSASLALRASPVATPEQMAELGQLRPLAATGPTLYLGNDDFSPWDLRGVRLGYLQVSTFPPPIAVPMSSKPWSYGEPFDFDNVAPAQLDRFKYVIVPNSDYLSQPPPNFRLVRSLPLYQMWQRTGPTLPRENIDGPGGPGAILDCRAKPDRALSRRRGTATVASVPLLIGNLPALGPGGHVTVGLPLPAGDWALALEYTSAEKLVLGLGAGGPRWNVPANLARPGPYFHFATVHSAGSGPLLLQIYVVHPSRFTSPQSGANLSNVAATRLPNLRSAVPLRQACGRYVDWYRI